MKLLRWCKANAMPVIAVLACGGDGGVRAA